MLLVEYFCRGYFFGEKKISLVSLIFLIIPIYNFNEIYVGNAQIELFQSISKLNDISRYL